MIRAVGLVALLVGGTGCLEFQRLVIRIDLATGTALLTFRRLGSDDPAEDAPRVRALAAGGGGIEQVLGRANFIEVEPGARRVVDVAGRLDAEIELRFAHLREVGLSSHDAQHPHRYCPADELRIDAANASARDRHGCVLWDARAKTLRIELVPTTTIHDPAPFAAAYRALK